MIPAAKTVTNTNAGSKAPAAPAAETADTPFDSILTLETLAATTVVADAAAAAPLNLEDLGLEGLAAGELIEGDDSDTDEVEDGEGVTALAFLADLLNIAKVMQHVPAGDAGGELDADGVAGSGKSSTDGLSSAGLLPDGSADAPNDKLSGLAALPAVPEVRLDGADRGPQNDDIGNVTRAAELIQGARNASTGPERSGIATHVRDPRWAEEFGTRIALMVRANESSASLQLSPVDLGPMDVSVTIKDSQASIHFGAAQAETRALIEASIPRLREMLAAQGFNLMDASVSQGFSRQTRGDATPATRGESEPDVEAVRATRITVNGLLDLYA